jgi:hypothetical protein
MNKRKPGYYWVDWTDWADPELVNSRPGPLVAEWDGNAWWFARMPPYRFDSEVKTLGECLAPPVALARLRSHRGAA